MLHAITFEYRDGAVVAVDRTGHGDRAFRQQQAVALVHRDFKMIGDHIELVRRHLKHRTGIDGHRFPLCRVIRNSQWRSGHHRRLAAMAADVVFRSHPHLKRITRQGCE